MCCFSGEVKHVSATRIFARSLEGGRQFLAYGMSVAMDADVAMVLPIPCPVGAREDAVRFVDMSSCPTFLDDFDVLFPVPAMMGFQMSLSLGVPQPANLVVHEVGDFEASFVPKLSDFARLDARFRLSDAVWRALPQYADWSFCVFKLKKSAAGATKKIHPMAFEFPRRDASEIFFPTVHVHDGKVHDVAEFDHTLYCQPDAAWEPLLTWGVSQETARVLPERAKRWVNENARVFRSVLEGSRANEDVVLRESALRQRHAFGRSYRLRMMAAWESVPSPADESVKRWNRVTEPERIRMRDAIASELNALFAGEGSGWPLADYDANHRVAYPDLSPPGAPGPHQLLFYAQNERVESQQLAVSFHEMPTKAVRGAIGGAFQAALNRAAAAVLDLRD